MKVSVVIVSYNARYYLEQCLYSVEAALKNIVGEIIVVDNDSPEKPIEFVRSKFPKVRFVESKENLGFGKANNLGVDLAKGEFVLILNPDTIIPENLFQEIIPFAEKTKDLGALGVRLIDANGKFHPESKRNIPSFENTFGKLFGTLVNSKSAKGYYKSEVGEFEIAPAEILVGAFMLLRKSVYQEVGGFDERYFMYGEDIDLSYTLVLNGFTNYYYGKSTVIHYKGESTRKDQKYLKIFFEAMNLFVDKYYEKKPIQKFIYKLGLKVRSTMALRKGTFKEGDVKVRKEINIDQLERIQSRKDIKEKSAQILLDGSIFYNQEILEIIQDYHIPNFREFYIHPKNMDVIIGDTGISRIIEQNP
jgi:N-acetylglucosaminyl-diphospho-decaprenol L-rhamnosyltransferase